jgi:hypothetical protein
MARKQKVDINKWKVDINKQKVDFSNGAETES